MVSSGRAEGQPGVRALPVHPVGSARLRLLLSHDAGGLWEQETLLQAGEARAGSLPGLVSE